MMFKLLFAVGFLTNALALVHTKSLVRSTNLFAATAEKTTVVEDYAANVMNTYGRYNLIISHGKGVHLFDSEGKKYLDCAAGISTCCLGYSHPKLKEAVANQMDKVHHCSNLYYIPEQAALAKWLTKNSCADKVFFCNSGAEANEAAIKLARKYAHTKLNIESPVIITALNSFHGRTLTAITATGQPKYQKDFGPLTPGFSYVEYNNAAELKKLVESINKEMPAKGVAAIMMESLQGEGGIKPGEKEFFDTIKDICASTGALMIIDEVQTGMGRTGKMWGHQQLGLEPDVFTSAKALGGGVPIGAMMCKEKCNVFNPGDHASTYGGNPLACAAGVAVTSTIDSDKLVENAHARGIQFRGEVNEMIKEFPNIIKEVRGWGLINGVELVNTGPDGLNAAKVTAKLMTMGVLVVPAGTHVVRFVPPLIISESDIKEVVVQLRKALVELSAGQSN